MLAVPLPRACPSLRPSELRAQDPASSTVRPVGHILPSRTKPLLGSAVCTLACVLSASLLL